MSRMITLPTVRNGDVIPRLLETALPSQEPVAAPIAIQDYPSPVKGVSAIDDSIQNSGSISVSDDARSTR